jgi:hypothetical protein
MVQPVVAESPAVEESIKEGGGEGRECAWEINNRVNVLVGCGEREWECGVERESEFPLLHVEAYGRNSSKS